MTVLLLTSYVTIMCVSPALLDTIRKFHLLGSVVHAPQNVPPAQMEPLVTLAKVRTIRMVLHASQRALMGNIQ